MEFSEFHNWVYRELGVRLNSYKETQLNRRITTLMDKVGINSLEEYKKLLIKDKESRDIFLEYITINVTEFFRNPEFFKTLEELIINNEETNINEMKIWSAGCSAGCEAYTLCMILNDIPKVKSYKIQGTDIDDNILKRAKEGYYTENEVKNVPKKYLKQYFKEEGTTFYIDSSVKSKVKFRKHDLMLDTYESNFDLIVCRNVLIYFKDEAKNEIIENFAKALKKKGILFVGATESINSYKNYGLEKISPFIYRKL